MYSKCAESLLFLSGIDCDLYQNCAVRTLVLISGLPVSCMELTTVPSS